MQSPAYGRHCCPHWKWSTSSEDITLALVYPSTSVYVQNIFFLEYEQLGHFCNNWHAFFLANVPCTEKQVSPSHLIHPHNSLPSLSFLLFLILLLSSPFCTHISRRGVPVSVMTLAAPESSLHGDDLFYFVWWSAHAEKKPGGSPHSSMLEEMTKAHTVFTVETSEHWKGVC